MLIGASHGATQEFPPASDLVSSCVMIGAGPPSSSAAAPVVVGRRFARSAFEPPELHTIHRGTVVGLQDFGAFIHLEGFNRDGLVHVSQMKHTEVGVRLAKNEEGKTYAQEYYASLLSNLSFILCTVFVGLYLIVVLCDFRSPVSAWKRGIALQRSSKYGAK
jgi:hypothetical protein